MDEQAKPEQTSGHSSAKAPAPHGVEPLSTGKGVKETIESILIAFILAFVFRAFVVEAFVIPTGSMATTLLGAHMRFTCKECGYTFDLGYSSEKQTSGDEVDIPERAGRSYHAVCPNCKYVVSAEESTKPLVRYGDRILVLKYLYIPWISSPNRWDVVVFKTPADVQGTAPYTTNYIKRLVGLPGETLMLLDGDLYVRHDESGPWEIQTKPRYAQDSMWRPIYDNDYRPLHNSREDELRNDHWRFPWVHAAGDGWDTGDKTLAREFAFDNLKGSGTLRFDGGSDRRHFTDWLAYDATLGENYTVYSISDLKLSFFYERQAGDGPLRLRMTKHGQEFIAEITPEGARLLHRANGRETEIPALAAIKPSSLTAPIRVDFSNVDYQVTLRLNDEVIFRTTAEQYQPNVTDLMQRYGRSSRNSYPKAAVEIAAGNQKAMLSHISLSRDVYYTPGEGSTAINADPGQPMVLGKGEYFVLGDNSAASADARSWYRSVELPHEDLYVGPGRVPERFLLGRAFFVYWPAGYRPMKSAPSVVPNFGDMRMIR